MFLSVYGVSDPSRRNGVLSISPHVIRGDSATPKVRETASKFLAQKHFGGFYGNTHFYPFRNRLYEKKTQSLRV